MRVHQGEGSCGRDCGGMVARFFIGHIRRLRQHQPHCHHEEHEATWCPRCCNSHFYPEDALVAAGLLPWVWRTEAFAPKLGVRHAAFVHVAGCISVDSRGRHVQLAEAEERSGYGIDINGVLRPTTHGRRPDFLVGTWPSQRLGGFGRVMWFACPQGSPTGGAAACCGERRLGGGTRRRSCVGEDRAVVRLNTGHALLGNGGETTPFRQRWTLTWKCHGKIDHKTATHGAQRRKPTMG